MNKRLTSILLIVVISGVLVPAPTHAFSLSIITKAFSIFKSFKTSTEQAQPNIPHTFPFGGHITSSEDGCKLHYWVFTVVLGVQVTFPGFPIPIGGPAIEVGPPVSTPGEVFIFPFISDVYRNNRENRVGPWALGIGWTPFPINQINDALALIPPITIGNVTFYNFSLSCPSDNVVLKLGTSF